MKSLIHHLSSAILICGSSLLFVLPAQIIKAESVNNQDADAQVKENPKRNDEIDSAALPEDVRKAVLGHLAVFAPHMDFEHYEWQNLEIVKFAKVTLSDQMRSLIGGLFRKKENPKEMYCITCQADEVCTKAHIKFRSCDVARINDRNVPLGYKEEIREGNKGKSSFNWIMTRGQSGKMYILNFTAVPENPETKSSKWAAVCPYEQIFASDLLQRQAAEKEECARWLQANPGYLKNQVAQKIALAKMLAEPDKSFRGYDDVIEKLGKPKWVTMKKVDNKHDPSAEDIIRTLKYPGLVIDLYQAPKYKKEFITRLTLTKRPKQFKLPVTLGASRDFALSRLGEPSQDQGDAITYLGDSTEPTIQFKDSRVSRIEWITFPN
jgi:hypothetical protein